MIQSLLIKLAMLAMTMGVVFWIAWEAPQVSLLAQKEAESAGLPVAAENSVPPDTKPADNVHQPAPAAAPVVITRTPARSEAQVPPRRKGLLDLNRASAEEIDALPGIGAVLARRVIDYRKSAGGFRSVDDLREVKGIGAKKLDRLRPLVMVSAPSAKGRTEKAPL